MNERKKEKKLVTTIPYEKVLFVWVSNHWDVHLNGICLYRGALHEFKNTAPEYDEEKDEWLEMNVKVFKLNLRQKVVWLWRKWLFEKCVGYHWTYPYRKTGERPFHYRKPIWLYKLIFNIYYKKP